MNFELITKNWPLKLLAFLIALFLWFYVVNDGYKVDYVDQEVQIEAFNLKEGLVLAESPGTVNLKIRVPIQSLDKIKLENLTAYVDLKDFDKGEYEREVKVVLEDPTIQIIEKNPEAITVNIDELALKEKEVSVVTTGEIAEGYKIGEFEVSQEKVEVKGASSVLDKVNRIVAVVPLDNSMSEILRTVELEAWDENDKKINDLVILPKTVEVKIPVDVESTVKTVGVKVNLGGEVKSGYWISDVLLSKNSVSIKGDTEELSKVEFIETESINVDGLENDLKKNVNLVLPAGIELLSEEPIVATVVLESSSVNREISRKPRLVNLDQDLKASLSPEAVRIVVEGDAENINNLDETTIIFDLDLKGLKEGEHTLTIGKESFRMPSGIILKEVKDNQMNLTLTK